MLKRTKGLLLLTSLVITGLAGTLNDTAISSKERKKSISFLKETKTDLLKQVANYSNSQLDYRPSKSDLTIRECIYSIAYNEKQLWKLLKSTMQDAANPEQRIQINYRDAEFQMMQSALPPVSSSKAVAKKAGYKSVAQALSDFKQQRVAKIKYIRTTNEDVRNHVAQTEIGWLDCYQLTLMMSANTSKYSAEIKKIMSDPGFPGK